mgnify:CR=1 FL=1
MARKARKKRDKKSRKKKNIESSVPDLSKNKWEIAKPKTLKCSTEKCDTIVENCGHDTTSVICWKCCINMTNGQPIFVKYEMNDN